MRETSEKLGQEIIQSIRIFFSSFRPLKDVEGDKVEEFTGLITPLVNWVCDIQFILDAPREVLRLVSDLDKTCSKSLESFCIQSSNYENLDEVSELVRSAKVILEKINSIKADVKKKNKASRVGRQKLDDFATILTGGISLALECVSQELNIDEHHIAVGEVLKAFRNCSFLTSLGVGETRIKERLNSFQDEVFPYLYGKAAGVYENAPDIVIPHISTKRGAYGALDLRYPLYASLIAHLVEIGLKSARSGRMMRGVKGVTYIQPKIKQVDVSDRMRNLMDWATALGDVSYVVVATTRNTTKS